MTKPDIYRRAGETATVVEFARDEDLGDGDFYAPPDEADVEPLRHGDVLKHPDSWRSTHVYIVVESPDGKKAVPLRFDHPDGVGDGYGNIDVSVTRLIADPIEFYGDNSEFDRDAMVANIELDPAVHAELLAGVVGEGRSLKPECEVRWVASAGDFEARIPGETDWEELTEPAISEFFV